MQIAKAMPDVLLTNAKGDGIPRISVHFQDTPANILRASAEGSFVISENILPHTGQLIPSSVPALRQQIVHTIRAANHKKVEQDVKAMNYYNQQTYFKRKLYKYKDLPIHRRGRLEDVMDIYSEEKLKHGASLRTKKRL